jgi:hypothetical protein
MRDCLRRRGDRHTLPFWSLLERAAETLQRKRGLAVHIQACLAAACLDLGFVPAEIGALAQSLIHHMILANAFEGAIQAPASLQRLPNNCVRYEGRLPRSSPRTENCAGGPSSLKG